MSTIRPKNLPLVTTVTAGDVLVLDGATVRSITVANLLASMVNLTGPITSVGQATSIASQTGTGTKFVVDTSPTLVTPVLGVAAATSINKVAFTAPAAGATLTIPDGVTLTGPAASGTVMTLGNVETVTGAKTFNDGKLILAGSSSGSSILKATAVASGTLTLPAATDTLVGKATTDVLTNKTLDSAGTGNVLKVSGVTVSAGQYPGTTTNDNATAGNVGEYVESVIPTGSATPLVSNTTKTITSISLTAGDWDVDGVINFLTATTTSVTYIQAGLSLVTNTQDLTAGRTTELTIPATVPGAATLLSKEFPPYRLSLSGTTTIFLIGASIFTVSTNAGWGLIRARRVR